MTGAERRVWSLIRAAARLADPADPLGARARNGLPAATGLSAEGVAAALDQCLETNPTEEEVRALCASVEPAPRAHVVLSANVFVAAHRAIALALAASESVFVRPSRRDPLFAELLDEASNGSFERVSDLSVRPGDHVFAYGSNETLAAIERSLPPSVVLHGHGDGMAVVLFDGSGAGLDQGARRLARDVTLFDQRGCLSPRVVFVDGSERDVMIAARAVAEALGDAESRIPRGAMDESELAAAVRYRDTMCCVHDVIEAGEGYVGVDPTGRVVLVPPPGRNLHVVRATQATGAIAAIRDAITAIGIHGSVALDAIGPLVPGARLLPVGSLQRPPFDGPVDRRPKPRTWAKSLG